ncbi:uncharacterized protein LOC121833680 [Ixodes scapularis]|uniref:uncharacterized protein LOC121833680 n=1 Tax=Ixodes scapularis TaxID=6945 RepID=UPI001C393746|nr:uncharacterized protein LOC121833680 [Ixodes scapularis]
MRVYMKLSSVLPANLHIPPLPKNMHPEHHPDHRKARSAALHKQYGQLEGVVYTDAADYPHPKAMTMVAIDGHGVPLSGGSIRTTYSETAEELAIAMALLVPNTQTIISDSKRAILNFARGRVSEATLTVLTRSSKIPNGMVSLIWAPARTSLPGNEAIHTTARELAYRARGAMTGTGDEPVSHRDALSSYQEITQSYRSARTTLPAGHKLLTKSQEWTWRRLQTNAYPNPALYSDWLPDLHSEVCKFCSSRATLSHIMWECPNSSLKDRMPFAGNDTEQWNAPMHRSEADVQKEICDWAEEAAAVWDLLPSPFSASS